MSQKNVSLSMTEEKPAQIPEEVQKIGNQAWQIIWQTAYDIAQQQINVVKQQHQQYETSMLQQRQTALDTVVQVNNELAEAKAKIESLTRENKSLQVDLTHRVEELKSAQDQIVNFNEQHYQQEHEIKRLLEEAGRIKESADNLQKRLHEANHQAEQDRLACKDASEEAKVNLRTCERLDKSLKTALQESEQVWKQLKLEQTKAAVADALTQELRETIKKLEGDIKLLKEEKRETKEGMDNEAKMRIELEKKIASLAARAESQEWAYKETIAKLMQELEVTKGEVATLRNRTIKAESALEREKKAIERLENKLVAASNTKF